MSDGVSDMWFSGREDSPTIGNIGRLGEERGPEDPEVQGLVRRIFMVSRIDQVVLLIVIAMMVFKPGG